MVGELTYGAALFLGGAILAWWAVRLWKRWLKTRESPILSEMSRADIVNVTTIFHVGGSGPSGSRWPEYSAVSVEEGRIYARLAKARSDSYQLLGEFLVAFGGALLGSVAFDVTTQGPDVSQSKRVAMIVAAGVVLLGLLYARVLSKWWEVFSRGYGKRISASKGRASLRRRATRRS